MKPTWHCSECGQIVESDHPPAFSFEHEHKWVPDPAAVRGRQEPPELERICKWCEGTGTYVDGDHCNGFLPEKCNMCGGSGTMKSQAAAVRGRQEPQPADPPKHIIDLAIEVAGWSPCRSKRGVVIFSEGNVISHGHNFKPRGFDCDGSEACKSTCRREAIHAEQAALLAASSRAHASEMLHVKSVNGKIVPSGGPSCVECSKLARAVGIAWVWLYHVDGWRRYSGQEFHALSLAASGEAILPPQPDPIQHRLKCPQHPLARRAVEYGHAREGEWGDMRCHCDVPPATPDLDLLAYGQEEATNALRAKDREQYQFWQGWCAALDKLRAALASSRGTKPQEQGESVDHREAAQAILKAVMGASGSDAFGRIVTMLQTYFPYQESAPAGPQAPQEQ